MKTQEQIFTSQDVPAALWRAAVSRECFWEEMRQSAAKYAAGDGKTLTGTPGTRHSLYVRWVTTPDGYGKFAECTEDEAEFARLTLTCWAEKP